MRKSLNAASIAEIPFMHLIDQVELVRKGSQSFEIYDEYLISFIV